VTTLSASSPEQIHELIEDAFNTQDLDAFLDLHEDGAATVVPPDGRQVSGHAAIRAALEPIFARAPKAQIECVGTLEWDGLALTHARLQVTAGEGEERLEVSGRGTIVSRRQPDGTWLIVLDNPMTPG
jgi:uncharacterized protein (TIGR02246 family)